VVVEEFAVEGDHDAVSAGVGAPRDVELEVEPALNRPAGGWPAAAGRSQPPSYPLVLRRLDRGTPAWIIAAMSLDIGLGRVVPGLVDALDTVTVGSVSLPITVGLLLMMYPRWGTVGIYSY